MPQLLAGALHHCGSCGFVFNAAFDSGLVRYGEGYEETQGYSATFREFERRQAELLIERHNLRGKRIIEIGSGKGDFLALLCRLGENEGVGYDPSFAPARRPADSAGVRYLAENFAEHNADGDADLIYSKMTLEHVAAPGRLLKAIRGAIPAGRSPAVVIQVPNWERIASECAFWDVYYEHRSYFSADSLAAAMSAAGFEVTKRELLYDNQYVSVEARPGAATGRERLPERAAPVAQSSNRSLPVAAPGAGDHLPAGVGFPQKIRQWRDAVRTAAEKGPVALWGGGSKAVSFLTTLGLTREVGAVVDINPYRQGAYLAGSGHLIFAPEALVELRPATVFIMNPVYESEIRKSLDAMNVEAETTALSPDIYIEVQPPT